MRSRAIIVSLLSALAVFFVSYNTLVFSSAVKSRTELSLSLPAYEESNAVVMEPLSYLLKAPGEFHDVDLPDDLKARKYPDIISLNTVNADKITKQNNSEGMLSKQPGFSIQVAMFKNFANAKRLKKQLQNQDFRLYIVTRKNLKNQSRYDVRFGHYKTRQQAESALLKYNAESHTQAYIISE